MLVISSTGPEVSNLLGLNITPSERGALQSRRRNLQNGQRRSVLGDRVCKPGNGRDQRREGKLRLRVCLGEGRSKRQSQHATNSNGDENHFRDRVLVIDLRREGMHLLNVLGRWLESRFEGI